MALPKDLVKYPPGTPADRFWIPFINALLKNISPYNILRSAIRVKDGRMGITTISGSEEIVDLPHNDRIKVLSVGKSALPMNDAFIEILGTFRSGIWPGSLVISPYGASSTYGNTTFLKGNHPIPGDKDIENTLRAKRFLFSASEEDLVFILLSGGASSLLFSPRDGITPQEKLSIVRCLMGSGADIEEMNTVRTYLSSSKGGGLIDVSGTDNIVTIAFSDVPDDDPRLLGSGPSYPWAPAREKVLDILKRRGIDDGSIGLVSGLPERGPPPVRKGRYLLIASFRTMMKSASDLLTGSGHRCFVDDERFSGTARVTSLELLSKARRSIGPPPSAFIAGGESTVDLVGEGVGGRNLEMALSLVGELSGNEEVLCMGSDGIDGISELAGALVTADTPGSDLAERYLLNNDSGTFFSLFPGGVRTGPTGINLGDLFVLLRRADRMEHPRPPLP